MDDSTLNSPKKMGEPSLCKGPGMGRTQSRAWSHSRCSSLFPSFLGEGTILLWAPGNPACLCSRKEKVEKPQRNPREGHTQAREGHAVLWGQDGYFGGVSVMAGAGVHRQGAPLEANAVMRAEREGGIKAAG